MLRSGSTKVCALLAVGAWWLVAGCESPAVLPSATVVVVTGADAGADARTADDVDATDGGDRGDSSDGAGDALVCDPSVTYASFGQPFFATYCRRCHTWDQSTAQESGDLLAGAAGPGGFMPPGNPIPTDQERARLVSWIACGAP